MARSLNMVQIIGNVTQDPDVRQIPSGASVATITVATNRSWKDQSGQLQEETEFHNIVLWRGLADIVQQYVRKGSKVYVRGYLKTRSWESQDGQKKYQTEIIADDLMLLTPKKDGDGSMPMNSNSSSSSAHDDNSAGMAKKQASGGIQTLADQEPIQIEEIPF